VDDILRHERTQWRGALRVGLTATLVYSLFLGLRGLAWSQQRFSDSTTLQHFQSVRLTLDVSDGADALASLAGVVIAVGLAGRTVLASGSIDARAYARERLWRQLSEVIATLCTLVGIGLLGGAIAHGDLLTRFPLIVLSGTIVVLTASAASTDFQFATIERSLRLRTVEREKLRYETAATAWAQSSAPSFRRSVAWSAVVTAVVFVGLSVVGFLLGSTPSLERLAGCALLVVVGLAVSCVGVVLVCAVVNDLVDRSLVSAALHGLYTVLWTSLGVFTCIQVFTDDTVSVRGRWLIGVWVALSFVAPPLLALAGLRRSSLLLPSFTFSAVVHSAVVRHIGKATSRLDLQLTNLTSSTSAAAPGKALRRWFDTLSGASATVPSSSAPASAPLPSPTPQSAP
jgi:hypothetical protein